MPGLFIFFFSGAWKWSYGDRLSDVNNFLGEQSPWLKDDLYFKFPFGYQTTKYTGRSFVASPVKEDEFVKPQRVYVRYSGNSKNGYTILANVLDHIRNFARNRRKQGENQKPVKHILEFNDLLPPTVEHRVPQLQYNYNQRPPVFSDSHNNNNNPFESIESLLDYLKQNSSRTNEKSDSGEVKIKVFSNPDKLPFFLGILPATLCTLLVLGYPPFQVRDNSTILSVLIHSTNPKSWPVGIIVFAHVVRPYVHFSNLEKHNNRKQCSLLA